ILANPLLTPADRVSNLFRELLQLFQPEDKRLSPRLLDEPLVRSEIIQMTEHYGNALLFHDNAKLRRLLVIDFLEALLEQRDALIPWIHDAEAIDPLANLLAI